MGTSLPWLKVEENFLKGFFVIPLGFPHQPSPAQPSQSFACSGLVGPISCFCCLVATFLMDDGCLPAPILEASAAGEDSRVGADGR